MNIADQIRQRSNELKKEKDEMRDEFNRVIDFAIEQGIEASIFLRSWREGDTTEWPEFTQNRTAA